MAALQRDSVRLLTLKDIYRQNLFTALSASSPG